MAERAMDAAVAKLDSQRDEWSSAATTRGNFIA